jgi:hypothetical protein
MHTSLNIHAHGPSLTFEATQRTAAGCSWISITIKTESGSFEFTTFNSNEVGLAALAQAINQINAAHFAPRPTSQGAAERQDDHTYSINKDGIIISPGKFEGEPEWAPYFYQQWLETGGHEMDDEEGNAIIHVLPEDRARFPELAKVDHILIRESDQGFVHTKTIERIA